MKDFLRQVSIFAEMDDAELDLLVDAATQNDYPENSYVIREGEPGNCLFIVRSGKVKIILKRPPDGEIYLSTFESGDFFGEMSLFDEQPRSATAITEENSTLVEISRESFIKQITKDPEIALKILAELSNRFRRTDETVGEFADRVYKEAYKKLEETIAIQLDSAKTIYEKTEERSLSAIEHVESGWRNLTRTIWGITTFFTLVGVFLGVLGFNKLSELSTVADEAKKKAEEATKTYAEIEKIGDLAKSTDILRHNMLIFRNISENLSLNEVIGKMDQAQLERASIYLRPSRKTLSEYLENYQNYQAETIVEAAKEFLEIAKKAHFVLTRSESLNIFDSHKNILETMPKLDWRINQQLRNNLLSMWELEKNAQVEERLIATRINSIIEGSYLKFYYFDNKVYNLIRVVVDSISADAADQGILTYIDNSNIMVGLLKSYIQNEKSDWVVNNSCIGLIKIGYVKEDNDSFTFGLNDIMRRLRDKDERVAFRAALKLGRLESVILERIGEEYNNGKKEIKEILIKSNNDKNIYLKISAEKMASRINLD